MSKYDQTVSHPERPSAARMFGVILICLCRWFFVYWLHTYLQFNVNSGRKMQHQYKNIGVISNNDFVGADATKWWIIIVSASSWVVLKFSQRDICPLKIFSEIGSFPVTATLCGNINIAFATRSLKIHWTSCSLFSDTFSITSLDCIGMSSVKWHTRLTPVSRLNLVRPLILSS